MKIEASLLRNIIEGALLAADGPLSLARLARLFDVPEGETDSDNYLYDKPRTEDILAALEDIQAHCQGRGYQLKQVASGWRFQVVQEVAPWVNRLWEEKPQRYSRALLETLALIAYRQPITRGDIEAIRGVAVSSNIIKTLTEREWVKVVGHRDVPGRPALYATTRQFLDYFNLKSLDELPSLKEIQDFDRLEAELQLADLPLAAAEAAEAPQTPIEEESSALDEEPSAKDEEPSAQDEEPSAPGEEPSAPAEDAIAFDSLAPLGVQLEAENLASAEQADEQDDDDLELDEPFVVLKDLAADDDPVSEETAEEAAVLDQDL